MTTLGINDIDDAYWLASRLVDSNSYYSFFCVRCVDASGDASGGVSNIALCYVYSDGSTDADDDSNGLRTVFTLKSGIKVTSGNGESGTPYTLGL